MSRTPGAEVERVPLRCSLSAVEVLRAFRAEPMMFGLLGDWADSLAVVGSRPLLRAGETDDPFAVLERQPNVIGWPDGFAAQRDGSGVVGGGWFGYLGYRAGDRSGVAGHPPARPRSLPSFQLAFYDHVLRLDRSGQWWFEALCEDSRRERLSRCLRNARFLTGTRALGARPLGARPYSFARWRPTPSFAAHAAGVALCKERIAHGDLYQANLALRLDSWIDGELLDAFCDGYLALRPEKAAFVAAPTGAIASFSPELFLRRVDRIVRTAPIKGTRALPADRCAAASTAKLLERSEKELAENVMIVDLMRNDLGRVCRPGTVSVSQLAIARAQAGVCNLVSEVTGSLAHGVGDAELLRATFPPGSVTGAPKLAAQQAIAELESTARDAYTGAIGYASPVAGMEMSVVIRTLESRGRAVWMGVGGGIVADSDPEQEAAEAQTKARPVLDVVRASLIDAHAQRPLPRPRRLAAAPSPRPDPRRGVFETMLVSDHEALRGLEHLRRLASSVSELYGMSLPEDLSGRIEEVARPHKHGRLRVAIVPTGRSLTCEVECNALPERRSLQAAAAETAVVPGGIGPHKWLDRRLIEALEARRPGVIPLLVDLDGYVLESTRASVFVRCGKRLLTPPLDGRILPGTVRALTIERAARAGLIVEQVRLHQSILADADEVLLTNALQRAVRVSALDGHATSPSRSFASRLHGDLRGQPGLAIAVAPAVAP